jgi:hypothetical protein
MRGGGDGAGRLGHRADADVAEENRHGVDAHPKARLCVINIDDKTTATRVAKVAGELRASIGRAAANRPANNPNPPRVSPVPAPVPLGPLAALTP